MQVTGGYFADPGVKDVPDLARCGYPDRGGVLPTEVRSLPSCRGTGGCVTPATVKEQLLYEVHDPAAYLTPDVTADFSRVTIDEQGKDRVRVAGASGSTRPAQLKVTVGFDAGFLAEAGVSYAGPAARARGRLRRRDRRRKIEVGARHRLRHAHRFDRREFAVRHRRHSQSESARRAPARCAAHTKREEAELMLWEVESLLCCGPAGGGGFRGVITPAVMTKSVLIDARRGQADMLKCSSHDRAGP